MLMRGGGGEGEQRVILGLSSEVFSVVAGRFQPQITTIYSRRIVIYQL